MYERTDKRRIYQIIDMYLSGKINESSFCDELHFSYDLELDYDTLMEDEYKAFHELSQITHRFSDFEDDIKNYPGVYHTKEEVKQKIIETKESLRKYFDELKNEGDLDEGINDSEIKGTAVSIEGNWLMCPICQEAWEADLKYRTTRCPKCNNKLQRP